MGDIKEEEWRKILEGMRDPKEREAAPGESSTGSTDEEEWNRILAGVRAPKKKELQEEIPEDEPILKPTSIIHQNRASVGHHPTEKHLKIRAQPWLQGVSKRTLKDVRRTWSPEQIYELITSRTWPYRTWAPHYHKRDRAFLSLLYLAAGRIGEVLSLRKNQFDLKADPQFVIIRNMLTEKVSPEADRKPFREEFPLPREGPLKPFTELILEYLVELLEEDERLFPFKRQRGHELVKHITGKWPHWFRAQGERLYANLIGKGHAGIFKMKKLLNIAKTETLAKYIMPEWKDYREEFLKGPP